ncbi:Flp pilus assembly complex ATPase component TadA, partial [Candidatus Parcubacteria bacterium]|nr:Flp pilus assembly complex ATPase component TadA [Candidatus Parcubacteria bacterium]
MEINPSKLKKLLVLPGHIKEADFESLAKKAKEENLSLWKLLVEGGAVKDKEIGQLVAQDLGYPFINLRDEKIDEAVLAMIPEIMARSQGIVVFAQTAEEVKVGMVNPDDSFIKNNIAKRFGKKVLSFFITNEDLRLALKKYQINLEDTLRDKIAAFAAAAEHKEQQNKTIVEIVDLLLEYAQSSRASDVHIEPQNTNVVIRFRIDSVMHEVITLSKDLANHVTLRIKIMAKMRTDEHRSAQDGKFSFIAGEESIDVRVSIVPVTAGENIVLRLLSASNRRLSINDLGLNDKNSSIIKEYIKHPHDMILSTGPTGSGKTSTLYGILKILNKKAVHIATIEDPVEYDIEGISQIQVNTKTNLSFAQGLRAIVRQDPDIIMVGE